MINPFKKKDTLSTNRHTTEVLNDKSPFAYRESFSTLRTNLSFVTGASDAKTILVTSALPAEGKSTTAINLAITLAKDNHKVLLLDADLRKPSIQRYLRIQPGSTNGLTDILSNRSSTKDAIGFYETLGIDVMVAGTRPPNPAELVALPRMRELILELQEVYDYIIVDAPPSGVVSDAAILSRVCDGALLVVRQNFSNHQDVLKAKESLTKVNTSIMGVILNNYDIKEDSKDASVAQYYYYYGE